MDTNLQNQIQDQMGVPPVPPMPESATAEPTAAPSDDASQSQMSAVDAMAAELTNTAPELIAPQPAASSEPAADAAGASGATDASGAAGTTSDAAGAAGGVGATDVTGGAGATATDGGIGATLDSLMSDTGIGGAQADGSAEVVTGNIETAPTGDLDELKKSMLKDLFPIMDRVAVSPEQRYRIYHEMIEEMGDKSLIAVAYETVKQITDDTQRAEALLFLVEQADK